MLPVAKFTVLIEAWAVPSPEAVKAVKALTAHLDQHLDQRLEMALVRAVAETQAGKLGKVQETDNATRSA